MSATPVGRRHGRDARRVDSLGGKRSQGLTTVLVVADAGHHARLGTEPGGGHRLVRALPAVEALERGPGHRLARQRQPFAASDEVDVHAADDRDARAHLLSP